MDDRMLSEISIKGYRSINDLNSLQLRDRNILIGDTGKGKTNFISALKLVQETVRGNLERQVELEGGARYMLSRAGEPAEKISFGLGFGPEKYSFHLIPDFFDSLTLTQEEKSFTAQSRKVKDSILAWQLYGFHDAGRILKARMCEIEEDNQMLRSDGSNLWSVLFRISEEDPHGFLGICNCLGKVMRDFWYLDIEPKQAGQKKMLEISYHLRGCEISLPVDTLPVGAIRVLCLATALFQPNRPSTMIFDEPEEGLDLNGVDLFGELFSLAALHSQIIVATQAPRFINEYSLEDLILVTKRLGVSSFVRLKEENFPTYCKENNLSELWEKGILTQDLDSDNLD